ncbi:MAG: excinuclease ABC subunit UvrA [Planctomycetota bacterium]|nr:excinuclease ABC subunit UvrA [Planctomycetota bacterium]
MNTSSDQSQIELRGVNVHNLKNLDLDIPHHQLVVFCGVSGSGKTSIALDTLYAEGQRRYIESFSAYTRQFLDRLEKPAADRIEGIPAAIAVTRKSSSPNSRSTIGTATEIADYLRLLYAKIGHLQCLGCNQRLVEHSPQTVVDQLATVAPDTRYLVAFPLPQLTDSTTTTLAEELKQEGFVRVIADDQTLHLDNDSLPAKFPTTGLSIVVDRLTTGKTGPERLHDSLETAFQRGSGQCLLLLESPQPADRIIDGRHWIQWKFNQSLRCDDCDLDYPSAEARLFSFNSPLGACPECEGFGSIVDIDMERVVPDPGKSLREGAIAPWNSPSYRHELDELLALADDYKLPVDIPYHELTASQRQLIQQGIPERDFGGLRGFFAWLERRKYKMHLRVFLSRWRSYRTCPSCNEKRLRPESLAFRIADRNIAELAAMKIDHLEKFLESLELDPWEAEVSALIRQQLQSRMQFLQSVGLGYLSLDRPLRTLSGGESQRVTLTTALGSSLVNMLYVMDEPSIGLHPRDVNQLVQAIKKLRDRGNTVVLVEHEEAMIHAADHLIEVGPRAGNHGGEIVFQGQLADMKNSPGSITGDYLMGRRGHFSPQKRRVPGNGWITLKGARGNNLQSLSTKFPLGLLCLVTGVSGSGKSTLVQNTLYAALCRRMQKDAPRPHDFDEIIGDGQIDDVIMVDQSPIGRSPRSNPVTYIKAFDQIRQVFTETIQARTRNYKAGHFSFNVDGGRCPTCKGAGHLEIDMQFLADVYMTCRDCRGTRYKKEILEVKYREKTIADVLNMTVRGAFSFFRGKTKVQARLKRLIDVGLDYLRLGQPANTLSAGEAQRLKLAAYTANSNRNRTLFILDEPTTGLHFSDIVKLLDCFDALLDVGHSLIVVEHNLQLMRAADYIIDLGPGASDEGGQVVATGTPEEIIGNPKSHTGQYLAQVLTLDESP